MKKSILNLGKALEKSEQKEITGGYTTVGIGPGGSCAVIIYSAPGFTPTIHRNISSATAQQALAAGNFGGSYCCSSCSSAPWY
ncbi:MAG: hypothetical protein JXR05_05890 [Flavobacteriaceae bacterium]